MFCSRCGTWAPDTSSACAACSAPMQGSATTAPSAPPPVGSQPAWTAASAPRVSLWARDTFAGFWRRFAATLVDGTILWFPPSILRVALGMPLLDTSGSSSDEELFITLLTLVLCWFYAALLESSARQATLGQQLLGIRVMDVEGRRITFGRATGRYFGQLLSAVLCGVGYLFNLWTSRRQTLHDLVSGCVLVVAGRVPREAPAQAGEWV